MPPNSDPPVQGSAWRVTSAYFPSISLLCGLIFWSGIGAISEVIIPPVAIFFALVTYGPTLHFAAQLIARRSVHGAHSLDARQVSRRARILTGIWIANVAIHVGLWGMYRHDAYAGIFLLPVIPGSQAILMMMAIVIRYTVDIYMTSREQKLRCPRDSEEPVATETSPTAANANPDVIQPLYQPSLLLLFISISLSIAILVFDFSTNAIKRTQIIPIVASFEAYIPTILVHTYLIIKVLRGNVVSLKQTTRIAGISFDLIPLWIQARALTVSYQYSVTEHRFPEPIANMVPSTVEILLLVYFAIRYTGSVHAERKRRIKSGSMEDDLLSPSDVPEGPSVSAESPTELSAHYHPSTIILLISITLSIACIAIESVAEPICGIPMTIIVYAPTIIINIYSIYQRHRQQYATTHTFNTSLERLVQLGLLWILTQAFYVFVWPVSQYLNNKVMNPWVRWPEVLLIVYIAVRYVRDGRIRNSAGIRLPVEEEGPLQSVVVDTNR